MNVRSAAPGQPGVVALSDEDAATELLTSAVEGLWTVVSQLTRLRRTRRTNYRVAIFGSARTRPGAYPYDEVKRLAAELAALECEIITGGGPGLMQAANEGAMSVSSATPGRSIGVRVDLPFEQEVNSFVGQVYEHKDFFSRLHQFMIQADAFVVVPGGIGTLLEMSMVWQLLQVHHLHGTPLILVGHMWADLLRWARDSLTCPGTELVNAEDLDIPQCVNSVEETVAIIRERRAEWLAWQQTIEPARRSVLEPARGVAEVTPVSEHPIKEARQ
ncbi:MAG TPA: LOG family protein [Chloroflexota bacterium]|nr:LOG family protein [Chloroflexota bacterium]